MTWGLWGYGVPGPGERTAGANGDLPVGLHFQAHDDWTHAYDGDTLIGYLRPHQNKIDMIKVHPEYRRRGIGTAMLNWHRENVDPGIGHSTDQTPLGRAWGKSVGWEPPVWNRQDPDLDTLEDYEVQRPGHTASRTAMPTYYHVAPHHSRDSILQHGLDYTKGEHQWGSTPGNYFWESEDDAQEYADDMTQMALDDGGYDEDDEPGYAVLPFRHDGPVMDDPEGNHELARGKSFYTTDPIPGSAFRTAAARTAMAWQDWADKVQHLDGGKMGIYYVNHGGPKSEDSQMAYTVGPDGIDVDGLYTNPGYRQDGLAESFLRRLHDDHPDLKINPGRMTNDGQSFHDRMLEKEPTAKEVVTARRLAMAWDEWAPKIEKVDTIRSPWPSGHGSYVIPHPYTDRQPGDTWNHDPRRGAFSGLTYLRKKDRQGNPSISVGLVSTHPAYRNRGIAESLMRRLHEDHPGIPIDPGVMTDDGQGFHNRMLEKEPTAKGLVKARTAASRTAMPWYHRTDDELNPGDSLLPYNQVHPDHQEVGNESWNPNKAYVYDGEEDDSSDHAPYAGYGQHIYEIEPHGDPQRDYGDGNYSSHMIDRGTVIKRLPDEDPYSFGEKPQWADPSAHTAARHLTVQQVRPRKAKTMTAAITVYTKPSCVQCTMTRKQLDKLGIEHQVIDVTADPDAHAYVTGLGYQTAPVVVVGDGERHWSGFSPDKIKALMQ